MAVRDRSGQQVFTVREIYAEMVASETRYGESTVFKTMQRMTAPSDRPPFARLERAATGLSAGGLTVSVLAALLDHLLQPSQLIDCSRMTGLYRPLPPRHRTISASELPSLEP